MKFISIEFENFRLLRNLTLDFSTDDLRKLTVIRAENESGKTTILNGMQWALYGDDSLPDRGREYRLHPIDWDIQSEGENVLISVTVDFQTTKIRRSSKGVSEIDRRYRVIRSRSETLCGNNWEQSPSVVQFYYLSESGSQLIENPEPYLHEELPPELREIFFTDGDRALGFIDTTIARTTKRGRVQNAIRSLLDLGVIESALKHVKIASSDVNKQAKHMEINKELTEVTTQLERIDGVEEKLEMHIEDAESQFNALEEKIADIQKDINTALVKGDREALKVEIQVVENNLNWIDKQIASSIKEHAGLFRNQALNRDLLNPVLQKGLNTLSQLHDRGEIPKSTIPVLEEYLSQTKCICGETLEASKPDGKRRRDHIQNLIDQNKRADEFQAIVTDLYFGSRFLTTNGASEDESWIEAYKEVADKRDELQSMRDEQGEKRKSLELQLDDLPQSAGISGLRTAMQQYKEQRDAILQKKTQYESQLDNLNREREILVTKRQNLLRKQKKGAHILAQLEVAQDIERVLSNSYERMTNEELTKVSELMNAIFLEMIGADSEQNAIIQKTEINSEFDIVVYGPNCRALNPDRDLNGASRRALTLAFILALTKVSEVKVANVIDTPLGMMSGYVKKSVLKTAIRESSQLILFLTRSELKDCEEILDKQAGKIVTLTNPGHYPRMLVNDPKVSLRTILRCNCNHREECKICHRRLDSEPEIQMAS